VITGAYTSVLGGGAGAVDTLTVVSASNIGGATVSGFEVLNLSATNAAHTFTASAAQLAAFTSGITLTTITAPNVTIAVDATTAARAAGTITIDNDATTYSVATAAVAGVTFVATAAGTIAHAVTGGDGNDVIDFSASTAAVNQTLVGGAGNDTIRLSGATLAATDIITGGANTDTLVLSGNTAITATTLTGVTEIENIEIANTTTAVTLTLAEGSAVAGTTTVTTAQTTGALTFTFGATTAGKLASITGGGGDDVLTGGDLADTLVGGAGADALNGGAGADSLVGGEGSDVITGGAGADAIVLTETTASLDVVVFADTAANNGVDTITGFDKTLDKLNWAQGTVETAVTGALTTTANSLYQLGGQGAGSADSVAAIVTAMNNAATWTAAAATAWIAISDDNSTAIYEWTDVAGTAGVQVGELTLVSSFAVAMTTAELATAFTIV